MEEFTEAGNLAVACDCEVSAFLVEIPGGSLCFVFKAEKASSSSDDDKSIGAEAPARCLLISLFTKLQATNALRFYVTAVQTRLYLLETNCKDRKSVV